MLQSPANLLWSPSTAATMLLAATMEGGLAMNFTSGHSRGQVTARFTVKHLHQVV